MEELIKLIKKFHGLMDELRKYYVSEIKKQVEAHKKLSDKLADGCKKAGEMRGKMKALVKEIEKHGNMDDETLTKIKDQKKELEDYEKEFKEHDLRSEVDGKAKEVERLESELAVISKE